MNNCTCYFPLTGEGGLSSVNPHCPQHGTTRCTYYPPLSEEGKEPIGMPTPSRVNQDCPQHGYPCTCPDLPEPKDENCPHHGIEAALREEIKTLTAMVAYWKVAFDVEHVRYSDQKLKLRKYRLELKRR